jgi:hypothetical protein
MTSRRSLILVVLFGFVLLTVFVINRTRTTSRDKSQQFQHSFDIGYVSLGHVFKKTVSCTNNPGETWRLAEIRQSCSCTQATIDQHVLKSGESTDITVQFTSPEAEADSQHSVQIFFKADCQPSVTISVIAKTRKPLSVDRKNLDITTTNLKPTTILDLIVSNYSGTPWTSITCDDLPTHIRIHSSEKQPTKDGPETWKLALAFDGSQLPSRIDSGTLTIRADKLTEHVSYLINHDEGIRNSPIRFDVGRLTTETITLRTTVQIDSGPANLSIDDFAVSARDPHAHVKVEQITMQRPGRAILTLSISKLQRPPGRHQLTFDISYGGAVAVKQAMTVDFQRDDASAGTTR